MSQAVKLGSLVLVMVLSLAACATTTSPTVRPGAPKPTVPPTDGVYKVGTPYQIAGQWYYPREDWEYDQTGVASWYGPNFHGKPTANGETFDQALITAAHPTLPMPTRVRVTNLENGKSLIVRVNDRGPFKKGRIIDLSKRAAELLGFRDQGTAMVRVQMIGRAPLSFFAEAETVQGPGAGGAVTGTGNTPGDPSASGAPSEQVSARVLTAPGSSAPAGQTSLQPQATTAATNAARGSAAIELEEVTREPVPGNPQLSIQAGAFSEPQNADRLRRALESYRAVYGKPEIVVVEVDGSRLYRVRIGPMASVDMADRALERLIADGYTDARIVAD